MIASRSFRAVAFAVLTVAPLLACAADTDADEPVSASSADSTTGCTVMAPPAALRLDPFYAKYCLADGVPVVTSAVVPDAALVQAARLISAMLKPLPNVRNALVGYHARYALLAPTQQIQQLPEHAKDAVVSRGVGSSTDAPVAVTGEENVLCYERDGNRGENVVVHEMGHTIMNGLAIIRPSVKLQVRAAYTTAKAAGKYPDLYAGTNEDEYWAEGVQDYLGAHQTSDPKDINTRTQIAAYDPALYTVLDSVLRDVRLPDLCPRTTFDAAALWQLQNVGLGSGYAFDNGDMNPTARVTGQQWNIRPLGNGRVGLTNTFTAPGQAFDTTNMAATAGTSGQAWTITTVTTGRYRLTNDYRGPGQSLEVRAGGRTIDLAPTTDTPAQLWTIQRVP